MAALLKELGYAEAADASTLLWVLNHPEVEVYVATDNLERPVGFVSLSHRPQLRLRGRIATIDELVVAEAWRGKGVGTKLVATAISRATALSAKRIELTTHHARLGYRKSFYERNGFVEIDCAVLRYKPLEK
ncbi:MAG: GNAT family N-acetyltransferase [Deltaproteobacteria bacterium]|nr:GNAT family N-acetyltransferase [Deltaproteobacteria bacterium]